VPETRVPLLKQAFPVTDPSEFQ